MKHFALTGFALALACLIPATVLAIVKRRDGVTLRETLFAGSDLGAHPERYVRESWVAPVKLLTLAGVVFFLAAVLAILILGISR